MPTMYIIVNTFLYVPMKTLEKMRFRMLASVTASTQNSPFGTSTTARIVVCHQQEQRER